MDMLSMSDIYEMGVDMKRIKELREKWGLSQQALADILHVTQQSVYKYEHDLAEPDIDILIHIAEYFNTTIDYIVGISDIPEKYMLLESSNTLTHNENVLLEYYRQLPPQVKDLLYEFVKESDNRLVNEKKGEQYSKANLTMDYPMMGQRIRQLRKTHGMSQAMLAKETDLSTNYIGQIERGDRKPSLETLVALCNALGTSIDNILSADG
jgi:transcriptional regulator with XRE-family HTH domain